MLSYLLNAVYCLLVLLAMPMVLWKRWRTGKYRNGWDQKLWGRLPDLKEAPRPLIWLHAVSVGEVLQLRQLIDRLRAHRPDAQFLVTTTTETGHAVACDKLSGCQVAFFPLDFSWSVNAALDRVQPDLIVLVELELWPNFILSVARRGIPLALINGRLSANSFRGYLKIRSLVRRLLGKFHLIGVQTEEYRERFLHLGASEQTTIVTGSVKFDGVLMNAANPLTEELRNWLEIAETDPVFVAGSTQAPEEQIALDVYSKLLPAFPNLRLIIVPRHPERGTELAELIRQRGFSLLRRSSRQRWTGDAGKPVVGLLDTVGELGACWGLADVAFVGGSFTNRGGQNMLEPAAFGAAVCFGPNTRNFRQIVDLLISRDAARTVHSPDELQEFVYQMLADTDAAEAMGTQARELILSQQGATDRTVALILKSLPASCEQTYKRSA